MSLTARCRWTSFLLGLFMTSLLHAAPTHGPGDEPNSAPTAVWSSAAFMPLPNRFIDQAMLTWDEAVALNDLEEHLTVPSHTRLWKAKAPTSVLRAEPVRHQPVHSMIEPVTSSIVGGISGALPRSLSGVLNGPRALFFFDAPPATNLAAIQPVPEASTWALMLAGLAVVLAFTRRRHAVACAAKMTASIAE